VVWVSRSSVGISESDVEFAVRKPHEVSRDDGYELNSRSRWRTVCARIVRLGQGTASAVPISRPEVTKGERSERRQPGRYGDNHRSAESSL